MPRLPPTRSPSSLRRVLRGPARRAGAGGHPGNDRVSGPQAHGQPAQCELHGSGVGQSPSWVPQRGASVQRDKTRTWSDKPAHHFLRCFNRSSRRASAIPDPPAPRREDARSGDCSQASVADERSFRRAGRTPRRAGWAQPRACRGPVRSCPRRSGCRQDRGGARCRHQSRCRRRPTG